MRKWRDFRKISNSLRCCLTHIAAFKLTRDLCFSLLTNAKVIHPPWRILLISPFLVCFTFSQLIFPHLIAGLNLECDATQLHLQVLLSLDENSDRDADSKRESAPGLYFVIDRQSYVVNHTLISKISVPNNSSGSIEPPSAFIGKYSNSTWQKWVASLKFNFLFFYHRLARTADEVVSHVSSNPSALFGWYEILLTSDQNLLSQKHVQVVETNLTANCCHSETLACC